MDGSCIEEIFPVKKTKWASTHHSRKYTHRHKHNLPPHTHTHTQTHTHIHTHKHTHTHTHTVTSETVKDDGLIAYESKRMSGLGKEGTAMRDNKHN